MGAREVDHPGERDGNAHDPSGLPQEPIDLPEDGPLPEDTTDPPGRDRPGRASPRNLPGGYEVHGLHVAPAQPGCEALLWLPPVPRTDRTRVRQHTCECRATIYELCQAGGLRFIRRTVRGPDGSRIHETERVVTARAEQVWLRLLLGQAR
ncbi:hypothetical protein Aph01nite_25720 [Acrocarpospora phusangensis]|uniref:Uncharacterized protein n=1 Tax=Acrocarpospora phusangensis TaxID=1070424 RepID=A0A919Q8I1_9ACTN|nr:hypothetical protein [Acrocarpospora phusangensis]GIH24262.1 hypothetical protein Aph01nite_25720 [Acrocarpospora phusangensis]